MLILILYGQICLLVKFQQIPLECRRLHSTPENKNRRQTDGGLFFITAGLCFASQTFIVIQTFFSILFSFGEQCFSCFRILFEQGRITNFAQKELSEISSRLFRIQYERILTFFFQSRIITVGCPITAVYSKFSFQLAAAIPAFNPWLIHGA